MTLSDDLFQRAVARIPGGVNSPVRAFKGVGGSPLFIHHAEGAWMFDEDGKRYIDYIGSWGPMILGHRDPRVIQALQRQIENGLGYGAPTRLEVEMAELVCQLIPSIEKLRMVNSGTEATMSAIRLARGYTGRDIIVKFEGCYHGHADSLLVKAGSGALTLGIPDSPGVPESVARHTLTLRYNDHAAVEALFQQRGPEIAAIIVEPAAGNMNFVPPLAGFLEVLRSCCDASGAVLIFDEVMTGFRVAAGGAQELYGVAPDLTTLGKIIGGGLPVGAFGGRADIMDHLAPKGPVYQAGTLSGNPLAMACGIATLTALTEPGFYDRLSGLASRLLDGISGEAAIRGVPFHGMHAGGMFGMYLQEGPIHYFEQVKAGDSALFSSFFHKMLARGIYLAPSMFEAGFVSIAHTDEDIDTTVKAAAEVFGELSAG